MAVLDLKKFSGLVLSFDGTDLVSQEGSVECGDKMTMKIDEMRPQLLNTDLFCPVIFYSIFRGVDRKSLLKRKNLQFDMVVIPQNLAGIEYVKTKGMNIGDFPVLLEVVQGYATLIMQTAECTSVEGEMKAVVIKLKRGEKYVIPPKTDFIFVNTRQSSSIVAMFYSAKATFETKFDRTRGSSLYIIRKNARQEIVQNPYFRNVNRVRACRPEELYRIYGLTAKTPIFKQILRKYDRFRWLHDSSKVDWTKIPLCG